MDSLTWFPIIFIGVVLALFLVVGITIFVALARSKNLGTFLAILAGSGIIIGVLLVVLLISFRSYRGAGAPVDRQYAEPTVSYSVRSVEPPYDSINVVDLIPTFPEKPQPQAPLPPTSDHALVAESESPVESEKSVEVVGGSVEISGEDASATKTPEKTTPTGTDSPETSSKESQEKRPSDSQIAESLVASNVAASGESDEPAGEAPLTPKVASSPEGAKPRPQIVPEEDIKTFGKGWSLSPSGEKKPILTDTPPDWVRELPHLEPNGNIYYVVNSGVQTEHDEIQRELYRKAREAIATYFQEYHSESPFGFIPSFVPESYLRDKLVTDEFTQVYERSFYERRFPTNGSVVLYNRWWRLRFDNQTREELLSMYREALAKERVAHTSFFAVAVVFLLGCVFGFLKLDTFTRGYYTKRLLFVAILVILGLGTLAFG